MTFHLNFEQQKNAKAIGITIGIHLLLLVFFLFFKYQMPMQAPPSPMGLEVNLGTSDNGFGTDQPEHTGSPTEFSANLPTANHSLSGQDIALHDLMTSNDNHAPTVSINNKTEKKQHLSEHHNNNKNASNKATAANSTIKKTVAQKPKYIFAGSRGDGQGNGASKDYDGGNEGIGKGNGDMGVGGGTQGATNYKGIPGGNGNMSFDGLSGRYLVSKPNKAAKFREGGKVTIKVTVDRNGIITDAHISSAANAQIKAIALQKLKNVKFNKAPNALPEQFGTITFDFRTH